MKKLSLIVFLFLLFGCGENIPRQAIASEVLTVSVLMLPIDEAVTQVSKNGFVLSLRLVCVTAGADTVIDKNISQRYNNGDSIGEFRLRLGEKKQAEIDKYQARHTIFTSAAFIASPGIIQSGLDGGE